MGSKVLNQDTHEKIRSSIPQHTFHYKVNVRSRDGVDAPAAHKLAVQWRTLPGAPRNKRHTLDSNGQYAQADGQWVMADGGAMWPDFPAAASGRLEMKTVHPTQRAAEFLRKIRCASLQLPPPGNLEHQSLAPENRNGPYHTLLLFGHHHFLLLTSPPKH